MLDKTSRVTCAARRQDGILCRRDFVESLSASRALWIARITSRTDPLSVTPTSRSHTGEGETRERSATSLSLRGRRLPTYGMWIRAPIVSGMLRTYSSLKYSTPCLSKNTFASSSFLVPITNTSKMPSSSAITKRRFAAWSTLTNALA
jgi:hypothetical protein